MSYRTRYLILLPMLVPMLFPLSCSDSANNGTDGRPNDGAADARIDAAADGGSDAAIDAAADGRADAGIDATNDGNTGPGADGATDGTVDGPPPGTIFAPITPLSGLPLKLKLIADGLVTPLKGKPAPGEAGRLYVVNQSGELTAVDVATGNKTLFLSVASRLVTLGQQGPGSYDERGFLGVAFHPMYATNGKFYTYTSEKFLKAPPTFPTTLPAGTDPDHQDVLAEWHANTPGNPAAGATFTKEL